MDVKPQFVSYNIGRYPWPDMVSQVLGIFRLPDIKIPDRPVASRKEDQKTPLHARFYSHWRHPHSGEMLRAMYRYFVREVAVEWAKKHGGDGPFAYQAVPTFRVCAPFNVAVGEFHKDADYGHPDGELNFWLPVTAAFLTNSLWLQQNGDTPRCITAAPPEMFVFDAVNTLHGNYVNITGKCRVSIDFRIIQADMLPADPAMSVNTGAPFALGGYYASELIP